MKTIRLSLVSLIIFLSFGASLLAQTYSIKATIKGLANKEIYMGHYFADKTYVKDTVVTDASGTALFTGKEKLDGGLYFIVLPSKTIAWEFLVTDDQNFSMTTDTSDYIGHLKIEGSHENELYSNYSRYMRDRNKDMAQLQDQYKAAQNDKSKSEQIRKKIEELQKQVKQQWSDWVIKNPGTFFATIVNAQIYPDLPEFKIDPNESNPDSVRQVRAYYYNKKHFFDNINFSDARLLRTAFLQQRLDTYFTKMVIDPDTIIKDGDALIKRAEANDDVFRFVVEYMLNLKYETKRMGMDKVLVHIGEEYYLSGKATWVDSTRMEKIKDRIIKTRPNILGKKAEDMKLVTMDNNIRTLYSVEAKYTIVAFWEPGCGHCKKIIPKLHDIYTNLKWEKDWDIEVFAVFTQVKEHDDWLKFIDEHGMTDWLNLWDPYGWSGFRDKYDIYSTPTIYLLDKDKSIIAKRIDVEKIEEFIENYEKYHKE